jgi:hypothetical protein
VPLAELRRAVHDGTRAQELVTDVVVPLPPAGSGSAYASVEHPASGFALVGAAALVGPSARPSH